MAISLDFSGQITQDYLLQTIDIMALNLWKCEKIVGMRVLFFSFHVRA